jgi:hypothetical protein
MRIWTRRFTRLTNGFSKKSGNPHAVAIYFMHCNFVRIHQTLRCTPATVAGVTPELWELSHMVKVLGGRQFRRPRGFPAFRCGGNVVGNCSIPASEYCHNPEPMIG